MTALTGAAGTLTVTSLTATRIAGTFSFTATPLPGSSLVGGTPMAITGGTFDVRIDTA